MKRRNKKCAVFFASFASLSAWAVAAMGQWTSPPVADDTVPGPATSWRAHIARTNNPHRVTAAQLGALTNVLNGGTTGTTGSVSGVVSGQVTVTFPAQGTGSGATNAVGGGLLQLGYTDGTRTVTGAVNEASIVSSLADDFAGIGAATTGGMALALGGAVSTLVATAQGTADAALGLTNDTTLVRLGVTNAGPLLITGGSASGITLDPAIDNVRIYEDVGTLRMDSAVDIRLTGLLYDYPSGAQYIRSIDGVIIEALNASNLSTGAVPLARLSGIETGNLSAAAHQLYSTDTGGGLGYVVICSNGDVVGMATNVNFVNPAGVATSAGLRVDVTLPAGGGAGGGLGATLAISGDASNLPATNTSLVQANSGVWVGPGGPTNVWRGVVANHSGLALHPMLEASSTSAAFTAIGSYGASGGAYYNNILASDTTMTVPEFSTVRAGGTVAAATNIPSGRTLVWKGAGVARVSNMWTQLGYFQITSHTNSATGGRAEIAVAPIDDSANTNVSGKLHRRAVVIEAAAGTTASAAPNESGGMLDGDVFMSIGGEPWNNVGTNSGTTLTLRGEVANAIIQFARPTASQYLGTFRWALGGTTDQAWDFRAETNQTRGYAYQGARYGYWFNQDGSENRPIIPIAGPITPVAALYMTHWWTTNTSGKYMLIYRTPAGTQYTNWTEP